MKYSRIFRYVCVIILSIYDENISKQNYLMNQMTANNYFCSRNEIIKSKTLFNYSDFPNLGVSSEPRQLSTSSRNPLGAPKTSRHDSEWARCSDDFPTRLGISSVLRRLPDTTRNQLGAPTISRQVSESSRSPTQIRSTLTLNNLTQDVKLSKRVGEKYALLLKGYFYMQIS